MIAKCLSIRNPLSYLVVSGIKDVENRSWKTDYRGTLYIHSSGRKSQHFLFEGDLPDILNDEIEKLTVNDKGVITLKEPSEYVQYLRAFTDLDIEMYKYYNDNQDDFYKTGCIVGKVDLVDIVQDSQSMFAVPYNNHWILKNAVLFKRPIPGIKGKLGFFNVKINQEPESLVLGKELNKRKVS